MKIFIVLAVFAVGACASYENWVSFKRTHGKKYKNPAEDHYRMNTFFKNKAFIDDHNRNYEKGLTTYHMKMNHFGDLSHEEFESMFNKLPVTRQRGSRLFTPANNYDEIPESIDWRQKGAVTPVKDQGKCGGCWAFSATGAVEGQTFLKTGKLVSLSEQNLIDCTRFNNGCKGGDMNTAFYHIHTHGGIDSEESYPYEAKEGPCRFKNSTVAATVSDYGHIPYSEELLKMAVAKVGPISVGIDALQKTFRFYSGGVYADENCRSYELNHAVLVVGYGSENGQDYWIVKNSWNTVWGEKGFFRLARNKNNTCGIVSAASYPMV